MFHLDKKSLYQYFLHIALVILGIEVVILANENNDLKQNQKPVIPQIQRGDTLFLDSLQLSTTANTSMGSSKLVFILTTTCGFCKENIPNWAILNEIAKANGYSVIGISLSSDLETKQYITEQKIEFPIFSAKDSDEFRAKNKIYSVPQTIISQSAQKVTMAWRGLLSNEQMKQAVDFLTNSPTN